MTAKTSAVDNSLNRQPILWSISGADCSGGAGIAADIKTGHNLNIEVCHLISANTVQNSTKLLDVNAVDVNILNAQAQALRFDKPPTVIKIGLIANREQIMWLMALLSTLKQQIAQLMVVYDPVGQASVGGPLTALTPAELQSLLPLIDVITPNLIEAKQLSALVKNNNEINTLILAERILNLGPKAVIIKGGHSDAEQAGRQDNECIDICLQALTSTVTQAFKLRSEKIATSNTHGGGCSFATALASFLAHGYLLRDAFTLTKAYINQGLALSRELNNNNNENYYGAFMQGPWPSNPDDFPNIISPLTQQSDALPSFPSLGLASGEKLGLYPVVDSLEWLECLLPLNLNIIQLRIKDKQGEELAAMIAQAIIMARDNHCRLFINDHWQLAIQYGAYGVHIGQEDLACADLSAIAHAGLRLGISTHGCYEFLLAKQLQPSYLAIGAIFPTKTKDMTGQIQGLENLKQILALENTIPVVAIGGINEQRLEQVWSTGVSAVAVVTAITEAEQPVIATKSMQGLLEVNKANLALSDELNVKFHSSH